MLLYACAVSSSRVSQTVRVLCQRSKECALSDACAVCYNLEIALPPLLLVCRALLWYFLAMIMTMIQVRLLTAMNIQHKRRKRCNTVASLKS